MWVGIPLFDLLGMLVFIPLLGRVGKKRRDEPEVSDKNEVIGAD